MTPLRGPDDGFNGYATSNKVTLKRSGLVTKKTARSRLSEVEFEFEQSIKDIKTDIAGYFNHDATHSFL